MEEIHFPLPEEFYRFVEEHCDQDPSRLRLEWHGRETDFDVDFAITQIECRQKFAKKLPTFVNNPKFIFPSVLAGEQASSEAVARFHASLIDEACKTVIDMTAGLGIDSIMFAEKGLTVYAVELDLNKQQCLLNNAEVLGLKMLRALCADSTVLFRNGPFEPDTAIFIDPHRRDKRGGRVYGLKDCLPDVTKLLPLWNRQDLRIYMKLSPMLDIEQTIRDIPDIIEVNAVTYKGECKELLAVADLYPCRLKGEILMGAVELDDSGIKSEYYVVDEFSKVAPIIINRPSEVEPGHYLYIPSAGMMKLGAWGTICVRFPGLFKLAASTPLYSSIWLYRTFQGRVLRVVKQLNSGDLKKLKGQRMNVVSRNYPLTADQLRKKAAVKDGDPLYLVGARTGKDSHPTLFLCTSDFEAETKEDDQSANILRT